MTQMTHISIYGPGNNARTVLEILAKLACFQPDETAADINAVRQKQENPYAPLLTQTLGLLQDLGETREPPAYTGTRFELKDVSAEVETLSAKVAERGKRKAEIEAQLSTFEQTKAQLYHLTSLNASMDEIFACKYLKVRFGRLPKDSFVTVSYTHLAPPCVLRCGRYAPPGLRGSGRTPRMSSSSAASRPCCRARPSGSCWPPCGHGMCCLLYTSRCV